MKPKAKMKKFDSVKMMRGIRDKLSERYAKNPEMEDEELKKVQKKYNISAAKKNKMKSIA